MNKKVLTRALQGNYIALPVPLWCPSWGEFPIGYSLLAIRMYPASLPCEMWVSSWPSTASRMQPWLKSQDGAPHIHFLTALRRRRGAPKGKAGQYNCPIGP